MGPQIVKPGTPADRDHDDEDIDDYERESNGRALISLACKDNVIQSERSTGRVGVQPPPGKEERNDRRNMIMKRFRGVVGVVALIGAMAALPAVSAEYDGNADGPWIYMDTVNIEDASEGDYLDYLGKGYVAVLEKVKAEGIIIDYGVMVKFTGEAGEGDVAIWWLTNELGDIEKVFNRLDALVQEMFSSEDFHGLYMKMQKIRSPHATNIYRAVTWTAKE
jgi:hypothetical protein